MDFEHLGSFYLGRQQGDDGELGAPVMYDAKDLRTHAFCVGMTGSGKTGLAVGMLEEAAIDGVPVIAIDPKGDLANLLLSFPDLKPKDFEPWVDPGAATRKGQSTAEFAASTAKMWKEGLAKWGQTGERTRKMRETTDFAIFTPGSSSGRPLSILGSLSAPSDEIKGSLEAMQERVTSAVSGILALVGADADPVQSASHVFLSTVLTQMWNEGKDVEVADLVRAAMDPPIDRIGVLDLDTFFPAKKRQALAMQLNSVLASPAFQTWTQGEPLEVDKLLAAPDGRPRVSILSIAHLGEKERQFFVTLLLNEVLAWVRTQPGTSSLRAILYIDEVFGYFPPVANPPSKKPMLTLLKQARAFGLGVMLATQNPADLDYKGLSNCGTWFLGRLQTERDKMRVLEGLETASQATGASMDRKQLDGMLSSMPKRTFLMNNIHDGSPTVFRTRWVLSYLRGPMTRTEIAKLCDDAGIEREPMKANTLSAPVTATAGAAAASSSASASDEQEEQAEPRPVMPEHVSERFLAATADDVVYLPGLIADSRLHYSLARADIDSWFEPTVLARLDDHNDPWGNSMLKHAHQLDFDAEPAENAQWKEVPRKLLTKSGYKSLKSKLKTRLYRGETIPYFECKNPKLISRLGETKEAFTGRVRQLGREARDLKIEKMRAKHQKALQTLQNKIMRAESKVAREEGQVSAKQTDTMINAGSTMLGWVLGGRGRSGIKSTARGAARIAKEKNDVKIAKQELATLKTQYEHIEADLTIELDELKYEFPPMEILDKTLAPKKTEIGVENLCILWMPYRHRDGQPTEPAFRM